ncbi:MAG: phage tail assembly chaperone [Caulobacter sp.]|nr:phage tail assembly chaperone [Caulobacter sp.]
MSPAWRAALRTALSLGLQPEAFWRLSLAEWLALTEAPAAATCLAATPADLRALMARFPDEETR